MCVREFVHVWVSVWAVLSDYPITLARRSAFPVGEETTLLPIMAGDNDNDDDLYQTAELQFGDNTRSIMMGCMIALLIEGVIVLILHTNWGRILEGTLLTSAAVTGICAVFCKWQRGFTI